MAFFGFLNIYCLRVNLSVALVAMVNHSASSHVHVVANGSAQEATDSCGNPIERKATAQVGSFGLHRVGFRAVFDGESGGLTPRKR